MSETSKRFGRWVYTYDESDNLVYIGFNPDVYASTDKTDWEIEKLTYDESGNLTGRYGPLDGSVDGQALLDWE